MLRHKEASYQALRYMQKNLDAKTGVLDVSHSTCLSVPRINSKKVRKSSLDSAIEEMDKQKSNQSNDLSGWQIQTARFGDRFIRNFGRFCVVPFLRV